MPSASNRPQGALPPPGPTGTPPAAVPPGRGWLLFAVLLTTMMGFHFWATRAEEHPPVTYTSFYGWVEDGNVARVTLHGQNVTGELKQPTDVQGKKTNQFATL